MIRAWSLALSDKVTVQLISDLPAVLWVGLVFVIVMMFRTQIRGLLPALRSLKLPGGVEAQFGAAVSAASAEKNTPLSAGEGARLSRRAARNADLLARARVLWIDDHPDWTVNERSALAALGVEVAIAKSTAEAWERIGQGTYDLLLSDIKRDGGDTAGLGFAEQLRSAHHSLPIIFYVDKIDAAQPTPREAFGVTNRPDELIDLILDVVERRLG